MSALAAVLSAIAQLPASDLPDVIAKARELRAASWLERLRELVRQPVSCSLEQNYESDDSGGMFGVWSGSFEGPDGLEFDDRNLEEGGDLHEDEAAMIAIFGEDPEEAGSSHWEAKSEFLDLIKSYADYMTNGDSSFQIDITPMGAETTA